MTRLRFYVGTHGNAGRGEAHQYLASTFGGYTRIDAKGAWHAPGGYITLEPSLIYEVLTNSGDLAKVAAETLARLCSQQSVLYTIEDVQGGST